MPVRIRLARHGAKKRPFYRIVVADSEKPRDGRFLETLGTYNPVPDPAQVNVQKERVEHWIKQGAKPSNTVKSLLKKERIFVNVR